MEFKITKDQIDELARTNAVIKERLNEYFPEAFKWELEKGKWYKHTLYNYLFCFNGKYADNSQYGIAEGGKWVTNASSSRRHLDSFELATKEEIEAVLIAEAKKKGYKKGVKCNNSNIHNCEFKNNILSTDEFYYDGISNELIVALGNEVWYSIFKAGQWAEILPTEKTTEWTPAPTEKTVITKEKALKILAKKLKVSPENIEIE